MKKLFISCPMKGRTEENIKKSIDKMHKIAEIVFDQELEVIDTYIEDTPPENVNVPIWYLGKSIQMMAEADYFIGIDYYPNDLIAKSYYGCDIERNVANSYKIPLYLIDKPGKLMPDIAIPEKEFKF